MTSRATRYSAVLAVALFFVGVVPSARADLIYQVADATYGTSAINITFSWDGNVNDPLTNFVWSTPLSNGTLTSSDIAFWDSSGFPDGITNLAVYLLTADPVWSEDCTGPAGGVSPSFCNVAGSRIDLNIRDAAIGTYGFQLNREADLTEVDTVTSGTLVQIATPEPSTLALSGTMGLLLLSARLIRVSRRT
jgi:hypothetical protein